MTTVMIFHEVKDGRHWAKAWQQGAGSRHEAFAEIGVTARTFRDPENPNSTALLLEVSDMEKLQAMMESAESRKAMEEDGLRVETMRVLVEFRP